MKDYKIRVSKNVVLCKEGISSHIIKYQLINANSRKEALKKYYHDSDYKVRYLMKEVTFKVYE